MMKIELRCILCHDGKKHQPGTVITVPDELAALLIDSGSAVKVESGGRKRKDVKEAADDEAEADG